MRIDVIANAWGSPNGASTGMAQAVAYFAETLERLGHHVRRLRQVQGFGADLVITTLRPRWRHTIADAQAAQAVDRLVYWHHAGEPPVGGGAILAAPPSILPRDDWSRHVVLPPSSWAVESGGECTGSEILVAGAGPAKGGHVALAVARLCPDLRWLVLRGRSSPQDRVPWHRMSNATAAEELLTPEVFLARARAVLSPTRFEVHPLLLVEAAVRGIPIVCSDIPATRCAVGDSALYVPMIAPAEEWVAALRQVIGAPLPRLRLRPYAEVVQDALEAMRERAAA